jgi:hypothetical protein
MLMKPNRAQSFVIAALAVTVVAIAAGCTKDSGATPTSAPPAPTTPAATPSGGGSPSPSPSAPPSPTADPATVFAADGIGPYVIGTSLADLQGRALVTGISESPLCDDAKGAEATGRFAGQITLSFRADRLTAVTTNSTTLVTPSGARVGMTLAQLQAVYGGRGTLITGTLGNKAFVVRVIGSGLGIVFYLDATNTRVAAMSGGEAAPLEDAARVGEGC